MSDVRKRTIPINIDLMLEGVGEFQSPSIERQGLRAGSGAAEMTCYCNSQGGCGIPGDGTGGGGGGSCLCNASAGSGASAILA
jgi:hypothetical protein